jgi:hypothetical protein
VPDADDFDVEELRRLMRGEAPRPAEQAPADRPAPRKGGPGPRKGARPAAGAKPRARSVRKKP